MEENKLISASRIKTFLACPMKYYYKYVLRLPEKKNVFAANGTACHKSIERGHVLKQEGVDPLSDQHKADVVNTYNSIMQEESLDIEDLGNFQTVYKDGIRMVGNYTFERDPVVNEYYFQVEIQGITFIGYIDQWYDWGFIDLKTNRQKPQKIVLNNDPQFILYNQVFKELTGEYPKEIYWHHLRTGEDINVNPGDMSSIMRAVDSMLKIEEEPYKIVGYQCNYCDFKEKCFVQ